MKCLRSNENVQESKDSTFKGKQVAKGCRLCLKVMVAVRQGVGRCKWGWGKCGKSDEVIVAERKSSSSVFVCWVWVCVCLRLSCVTQNDMFVECIWFWCPSQPVSCWGKCPSSAYIFCVPSQITQQLRSVVQDVASDQFPSAASFVKSSGLNFTMRIFRVGTVRGWNLHLWHSSAPSWK